MLILMLVFGVLGFRAYACVLEFRVSGFRVRVEGFGFRVQG